MSSAIQFPRPPSRSENVLTWARQVSDYLRSSALYSTDKVRVVKRRGGTTLDVDILMAATPATTYPWQPYRSMWTGTGADPNAADRVLRFRLRDSAVNGYTPSNMNTEFLAFGDATDSEIEEKDAVVTIVYWQADVAETATSQGDLQFSKPAIMTVEATVDQGLTDVITPPAFGTDGSLPSYIVGQICKVSWWGGTLHFPPGLSSYQSVVLAVSGAFGGVVQRGFFYSS